jgi:ribonuclease P protein component
VQRIKTRAQFQAAMAGTVIARTPHFVLHCAALDEPQRSMKQTNSAGRPTVLFPLHAAWLGAMVPKRWAKRAVTRNAIKRQIYSVSNEIAPQFAMAAHVVRLRSTFDRARFASATSEALKVAVRRELGQLFGNLAATGAPATAVADHPR